MTRQHLVGLDILRVLSALSVMAFHFCFRGEKAGDLPALHLSPIVETVSSYGYLGVHIFFMISGFVIAYSAENATPYQFLTARFARIYPTFVIAMSVTTLLSVLSGDPKFYISIQQYAANLIISSPLLGEPFVDGAYWSIVLEIIFYAWIFLTMIFSQLHRIVFICTFWIILSYINEHLIHYKFIEYLFITEYSGFFALGISIYSLKKSYTFQGMFLLILASAYAIFTATNHLDEFAIKYSTKLSPDIITACLISAVLIFIIIVNISAKVRVFSNIEILGGSTYPQYLCHQNIGYLTISAMLVHFSAPLVVVFVSALMVSISTAFHILIERRITKTVKRLLSL